MDLTKMTAKKVVLLYTELAGYTVECLNHAAKHLQDVRLTVVRYPINPEAPFKFSFHPSVEIVSKAEFSALKLQQMSAELVLVSGWADREYNQWVTQLSRNTKKVVMFDNFWEGSWRQRLGQHLLKPFLRRRYNACWVPGVKHLEYSDRLGFSRENVQKGMYATDLEPYLNLFRTRQNRQDGPGKFLYVGRYLELKGVKDLWTAYRDYRQRGGDWELHLAGTGELWDERPNVAGMHHHGFMQRDDLMDLAKSCDVLVMPSHYDHWGVAVQEMAAVGLPLILSDQVASGTDFLKDHENGRVFEAKNTEALANAFWDVSSWTETRLAEAAQKSHDLSQTYNTQTWTDTLSWYIDNLS